MYVRSPSHASLASEANQGGPTRPLKNNLGSPRGAPTPLVPLDNVFQVELPLPRIPPVGFVVFVMFVVVCLICFCALGGKPSLQS